MAEKKQVIHKKVKKHFTLTSCGLWKTGTKIHTAWSRVTCKNCLRSKPKK